MNTERLVESFKDSVGDETSKRVLSDPGLMFKATRFFNEKLCHSCKRKVLKRVGEGKKFNKLWLCYSCKIKYDSEVN